MVAGKISGLSSKFSSECLRDNRGLVIETVRQDGSVLNYLSGETKNDGYYFEYASVEIRKHWNCCVESVEQSKFAIVFRFDGFRKDRKSVIEPVKQNGVILEYISEDLKCGRDFMPVMKLTQQEA